MQEINISIQDKKSENEIVKQYILSYFQGIQRYIEKKFLITINEFEFSVKKCEPSQGYVSKNTKLIVLTESSNCK